MVELKKKKTNQSTTNKLQSLTFEHRKQDITEEMAGKEKYVDTVCEKYPFLKNLKRGKLE